VLFRSININSLVGSDNALLKTSQPQFNGLVLTNPLLMAGYDITCLNLTAFTSCKSSVYQERVAGQSVEIKTSNITRFRIASGGPSLNNTSTVIAVDSSGNMCLRDNIALTSQIPSLAGYVDLNSAQTLTNKSIDSATNTITVNSTNVNSLLNQAVLTTSSPSFASLSLTSNTTWVDIPSVQTISGAKTFSGITTISNSTTSTAATNGACVITGGLGVGGACFMTGAFTCANIIKTNISTAASSSTTGSLVCVGGFGCGGSAFFGGHICGQGTMTGVASTGVGTGPTLTVNGNKNSGWFQINCGTSPSGTILYTFTLSTAAPSANYAVCITPRNQLAAGLSGVWATPASTTTWTLNCATTLIAASIYQWQYMIFS